MNWLEFVKIIYDQVEDSDARFNIYYKMIEEDLDRECDEAVGIDDAFDAAYSEFVEEEEDEVEFEEDQDYEYDDE